MGGDHKCPVCQATFTRPQHVARHMRSHTGDRPYKCQYCGDQFARSDLLSRHINKCHANEKPLLPSGSRRKGSAASSRATTSKQACDQCVQSSLPCDGCNPCAKCVQRKCRCTFVKFHRQTAPTGPGHNLQPPLSSAPTASSSASSSSRPGLYSTAQRQPAPGTNDNFLLGPAPQVSSSSTHGHHFPTTMADNLYSETFSFVPLYPGQSPTMGMGEGSDFASRYRAQAEILRRAGEDVHQHHQHQQVQHQQHQPPPHQHQHQHQHQESFQDHRSSPATAWVGWDQGRYPEATMNDKDLQQFLSSPGSTNPRSSSGTGTGMGMGMGYPPSASILSNRRRSSLDFSSSDGSSSSIPSSAASSTTHLPMEGMPIPQTFPSSAFADASCPSSIPNHQHSQHRPQQQQQQHQHQHRHHSRESTTGSPNPSSSSTSAPPGEGGGFSSAFGLMSLDDPAVLAGLSSDAAPFFSETGMAMDPPDPDATPMPMPMPMPMSMPMPVPPPPSHQHRHQQGQGEGEGQLPKNMDMDTRELREFWKEYMRTPLGEPESKMVYVEAGGAASSQSGNGNGNGNGNGHANGGAGMPGYHRRPRVASMLSSRTPTTGLVLSMFLGQQQEQKQQHQFAGGYAHQQQQQQQGQVALKKKHPLTTTLYQHQHQYQNTNLNNRLTEPAPAPPAAPPPQRQRQTIHGATEDLRSYEAAVLARKAPVTLTLKPPTPKVRRRGGNDSRTTGTSTGRRKGSASTSSVSVSASVSPQMPFGALGMGVGVGEGILRKTSRPGSAGSTGAVSSPSPSLSSSSSSSLANVFGRPPSAPSGMRVSFASGLEFGQGQDQSRGEGQGSASPDVRSRESSVAVSDGSGSADGGGKMRPSFKRLPSQILEPPNVKRAMFMRGGGGGEDHAEGGVRAGVGGEAKLERRDDPAGEGGDQVPAQALETLRKDGRHVVRFAERRRMSAPKAGVEEEGTVPPFALALGDLP